ncbi:protein of unknown function [Taphrina deformans PYCC 5710]|uniref:Uncharacterized protein n=1 Tax=Taphrina deformans (strain PYCC 5710 / ATCC 11124 / CBS 356.35 / IMI 108563 / JCM 9778 / NBRC 8474) TaxID=1097556 RepID=R4XH14_TAPDE|nr:protein of unknown function [Taphrina deformans PYCC 5710]|eukprot:CCG83808.1 protein of unknown function [Taphrina deformans PYCC 5710]
MSDYKPTEHDGLKKDGTPDKRVAGNQDSTSSSTSTSSSDNSGSGNSGGSKSGEFAHGKVDPVEAGKKGGQSS